MNSHKKINEMLSAYVLGELSPAQNQQIQSHLAQCRVCTSELERLESVLSCAKNMHGRSVDDNAVEAARVRLLLAVSNEKTTKQSTGGEQSPAHVWRTIMKSQITKIAAAAVVMIGAVGLFIGLFHNGAVPVWAADETFRALDQIKTAFVEGKDWYGQKFLAWVEVDSNGFITKWHIENPDNHFTLISTPDKSYQYRSDGRQVQINTGPLIHGGLRIRSLFEDIQNGNCQVSSIRRDNETVLVCTFIDRDWKTVIEIDPMSKLPMRLQIDGPVRPGSLFKKLDTIHYNVPLPENIFSFTVEPNMTVMDLDKQGKILRDPNNGIKVGDLKDDLAAKHIAEEYCNALLKEDIALASKLSPLGLIGEDKRKITDYTVFEPRIEGGCGYGPVVKCMVRYEDGTGKRFNLIVQLFNETDGKRGVIAGYWSTIDAITSETQGFIGIDLVNWPELKVIQGMPAERAGIKDGDVVIKVDDKDISEIKSSVDAKSFLVGKIGDKVSLTIKRGEQIVTFEVVREP